jgi:hypothetical protein
MIVAVEALRFCQYNSGRRVVDVKIGYGFGGVLSMASWK